MEISVVICTKNEEKKILRCLEAVQSIADEIVIVDSFSTDRTPEICRNFPRVQFYQMPWLGFSETKNKANDLATKEYILSLDADEVLSTEIQNEIKALKSKLSGVYEINRKTNYCGHWINHSGWFPDRHARIFPKGRAQWSKDLVHEKLIFSDQLNLSLLKGLVYHYSVDSREQHIKKIEAYSALAANRLAKKNKLALFVSMLLSPTFRFFRHYVIKLGFLDGVPGLVISGLSAYGVYLKYKKALLSKP